MNYKEVGVNVNTILIPNEKIDPTKWAVIACDQYTSEEQYWKDVEKAIQGKESTLNLMLPEIYLEKSDKKERIQKIQQTMKEYVNKNIFKELKDSIIYVERKLRDGKTRKGLIFSVDLENYSYEKGTESLIRPTEGTIIERIPPRKEIRNGAAIELPHIMFLIDDDKKEIIEPLAKMKLDKIYDFDLMLNSGHLTGYAVKDAEPIITKFKKLIDQNYFNAKYKVTNKKPILFAVGDGNHSLATAKSYWEDIKKTISKEELETHPARYALIELVNLYDESLEFEAIYRVLFNINTDLLNTEMKEYFAKEGVKYTITDKKDYKEMTDYVEKNNTSQKHVIGLVHGNKYKVIVFENPKYTLSFATVQNFLDYFIKKHNVKIDYIHGKESLQTLANEDNNLGIYLKSIQKSDLFITVIKDGVLPRKTFSMGHAYDKRFYYECRKIIK